MFRRLDVNLKSPELDLLHVMPHLYENGDELG